MNDATRANALATAVTLLEQRIAVRGWESPIGVFALVRTANMSPQDAAAAGLEATDADHLTPIEQEGLPQAESLEELLAQITWPDEVDGAAICVERITIPPEVEQTLPADPDEAMSVLMDHPQRQDVRIVVGVMRGGDSWCVLRSRANDSDDAVAGSPDAAPGLVHALGATLL